MLGWSWAIAVAAANIIWCMPQHSIAYGVLSKNLPTKSLLGSESAIAKWGISTFGENTWLAENCDKLAVSLVILVFATIVTWGYDRGGLGLRIYEMALKIVVALIVLCFLGVVITLTFSNTDKPLPWGEIFAGFVPDFGQFFRPADTFLPFLDAIGQPGNAIRDFWSDKIVAQQRDVIISAAATAVGINMTLMFPYTMLRKGWTKEFRGLSIFDLSTGMFIPFVAATSFVVIAAAASFHTQLPEGFSVAEGAGPNAAIVIDETSPKFASYTKMLDERNNLLGDQAVEPSNVEQRLSAMLVKRNALDLAKSLEPLTGERVANWVFGLGVLAMVLSTISILMLISGFVYAEMLGYPAGGKVHKLGTLIAGVGGAMWPFLWAGESQIFLAVVTSVFGFMLLPFAYVTFVFLMNSKSLLGENRPRGMKRFVWNVLMIFSATIVTVAAVYVIWVKADWRGLVAVALFIKIAIMVWVNQRKTASNNAKTV